MNATSPRYGFVHSEERVRCWQRRGTQRQSARRFTHANRK